ncbi:NAD(P)-dependent oxidoreductase [Aquimarina pacifica]|uniref:NAD(P)-dependent oxidoreductase n=1 Tax=Aquimarina pacifica TaxID=1296415 RepID=UPI000471B5E0|nr:NAD(P)-dependent oxidoreductase [Aquimarina pacifica]
MKILIYSAKDFEIPFLEKANNDQFRVKYIADRLTPKTARLALGFNVVSIFSSDDASSKVLELLWGFGVKYVILRSAGYDNVNLKTAERLGMSIANAPDYSPNAIAEHAVALLQTVNRKIILADTQVHNYNFLLDNLIGFDLYKKKIGIIGTGKIGKLLVKIMHGFGCEILANDVNKDDSLSEKFDVEYVTLKNLCSNSNIIIIAVPLTTETHHMIDTKIIDCMKKDTILINIARGAIVKTEELILALKSNKIRAYATDVYEYEDEVFFYDRSQNRPKDVLLKQLIDLPNVVLTPHQAFATQEALTSIAQITFSSIICWQNESTSPYELTEELVITRD